ncbi:DSPc domain containing protein [Trichuris trichiura]|uniref:DSPc domain containing protein n=1 Tax=Trichuris trichiura TaxID=36087 RepID=A0A077ZKV6_TRITR|nr:DSPc domain containing protein [Trichuris trichiura]
MKEYGFPLEEALNYVKEKRNCITPNRGFMEQLKIYEGILDASRNRTSILWNSLSSEKALYDHGIVEEHLSEDRNIPRESVVYSCKDMDDSVDGVQSAGLLVASENILKSGPIKATNKSQSVENFGTTDCDKVKEVDPVTGSHKLPAVTLCYDLCNDGSCQEPDDLPSVYQTAGGAVAPTSRYSVRQRLLHLEQRIRDQPLTLKSLQSILMSSKKICLSNLDSLSSSSGEESDFSSSSALIDGDHRDVRRNSKSSSSDSAVSDLTASSRTSRTKRHGVASSSVGATTVPFRRSFPEQAVVVASMEKTPSAAGYDCDLKCRKAFRRSAEDLSNCKATFNICSGQVMRALRIYESQLSREKLMAAPRTMGEESPAKPSQVVQHKKPLTKFWENVFQKSSAQPLTLLLPNVSSNHLPLPRTVTTKWHCDLQSTLHDDVSTLEGRRGMSSLSSSGTKVKS